MFQAFHECGASPFCEVTNNNTVNCVAMKKAEKDGDDEKFAFEFQPCKEKNGFVCEMPETFPE